MREGKQALVGGIELPLPWGPGEGGRGRRWMSADGGAVPWRATTVFHASPGLLGPGKEGGLVTGADGGTVAGTTIYVHS